MDEIEPQPDVDERLADLRRRRVEAADVLAETLLDIYLRGRQAKRAGKPWPPYEPLPPPMPDPPKPPPKRARPGLVRKYRASALPARRLERYRQLDPDGILVAEST
ncbi:MAG: hypothetical protein IPK60_21495 [Sandaracinaceae bacterium]|nr:hypothetical protein [Sandaracinaceae bacterium]